MFLTVSTDDGATASSHAGTPPASGGDHTTTDQQTSGPRESSNSASQASSGNRQSGGQVSPGPDGQLGSEKTPSSSSTDSTVGDSNDQDTHSRLNQGTPSPTPNNLDIDPKVEQNSDSPKMNEPGFTFGGSEGSSAEPGPSEPSDQEGEGGTEAANNEDPEMEKVRARERYKEQLEKQRVELLHQQAVERRQQQQQQEEVQDMSASDSKQFQRTSSKTLLEKERERLLQQQQQQQKQQQKQQQSDEEGKRTHKSQINVESRSNSQQSLYDSGMEEQDGVDGGRGIGEDGGSGEMGSDSGEGGDGSAAGEDVKREGGGEGERGGEGEAEDETCDPQTPGDCPEIKDGR